MSAAADVQEPARDTLVTTTERTSVNLSTHLRRAPATHLRRVLATWLRRRPRKAVPALSPERLVTGWSSDLVSGPLPSGRPARSESVCEPRSACECGSPFGCGDVSQMCGEGPC